MSKTNNKVFHGTFYVIGFYFMVLILSVFISYVHSSEFKPVPISLEEMNGQEQTSASKVSLWGKDITISTGSVVGGISSDCDTFGNIYAARCTTHTYTSHNAVRIYKSIDQGQSWQVFWGFYINADINVSMPVVLVGQFTNNDWLYIIYMTDVDNGDIGIARVKLDSTNVYNFFDVVSGVDTITYISACKRFNTARHLFVAYQKEEMGDATPDIHIVKSTDYGATWTGDQLLDEDGAQPDIAYGKDGYVFIAFKRSSPQSDIRVWRSTDQGSSWTDQGLITSDAASEEYPSVGVIHTNPPSSATVWVTYNYYRPTKEPEVTLSDIRYAYSTDAGDSWSTNHVLAGDADPNEMASDLNSFVDSLNNKMEVCYLKVTDLGHGFGTNEIYYSEVTTSDPVDWEKPISLSDNIAAYNFDGKNVCRITYGKDKNSVGVVYAGRDPALFGLNFQDFYFDAGSFSAVKDDDFPETKLFNFSLSNNYPNPFNPETNIGYTLPKASHVKLEIFNILGQRIRTVVDEYQTVGKKEVTWNGTNEQGEQVASGVYFYRLQAKDFIQTKKMVLMR